MRVLVDETVVLEYVGERQPYCACWDKLNALELVGAAELWSTPEVYRVMERALREELPASEVSRALLATLDFIKVCSVDGADVAHALGGDAGFDAGLLDACARKVRADYVVTCKAGLRLPTCKVPVVTPEGMFEHLEQTRGVVFDLVDF